jgi:sorting nexin-9/18/33
MSRAERLLSYSLLSLITSKPLATASTTTVEEEEEEEEIPPWADRGKGTMNSDGAWCWREGCTGKFNGRHSDRS